MARYVYRNIIIMCTHYLFIAGPVCWYNLLSTIKYSRFHISFVVVEKEFAIFFYYFWVQFEIMLCNVKQINERIVIE